MDKKTIAKNVITIILVQVVLSAFYPLMSRAQQWDVKAVKTITGRTIEIRDLKEYILKHMDSLNIPGLSIAVINNGIVAYSANLGVKNFTSKEPVDTNTIFEACSLSKPVFAYFTLVLANRGVLHRHCSRNRRGSYFSSEAESIGSPGNAFAMVFLCNCLMSFFDLPAVTGEYKTGSMCFFVCRVRAQNAERR